MAEDTEVVRTRRIEVVDDMGKVRIVLGMHGYGASEEWGIAIKTDRGDDGSCLLVDGQAAELTFIHRGNVVANIGADERGNPQVAMADANGVPVAGISQDGPWPV